MMQGLRIAKRVINFCVDIANELNDDDEDVFNTHLERQTKSKSRLRHMPLLFASMDATHNLNLNRLVRRPK